MVLEGSPPSCVQGLAEELCSPRGEEAGAAGHGG